MKKRLCIILALCAMGVLTACGNSNRSATDNKVEQTATPAATSTTTSTATSTSTATDKPTEKVKYSNNSSSSSSSGKCQFKYSDGSVCGKSTNKYKGLCDAHFNQLNDTYNDLIGF